MKNKIGQLFKIIFPYKKINFLIISMFLLGIITGAIFINIINVNDKNEVILQIESFIQNINNNSLSFSLCFKNSLLFNISILTIIFILGMTIIGTLLNIFILFSYGFIVGFSLGSFILTFKIKGIILSSLYVITSKIISIFIMFVIVIYSIIFNFKLCELIFKNRNINIKKTLKMYTTIYLILILFCIISSTLETFLFPNLIKLIIKLFT